MRIFGPARGTYEYLFRAFTYRGWGSYVCLDYAETLFISADRRIKGWLRKEARFSRERSDNEALEEGLWPYT